MKRVLLVAAGSLAAIMVTAAPAGARSVGIGIPNAKTPDAIGVPNVDFGVRIHRDRFRHDRCDGRRDCRDRGDRFVDGGGSTYAYLDLQYDPNRSFDPDLWNDWWHERPWRAYPRWVWNNDNCEPDRMWWSGSGWRCTPGRDGAPMRPPMP